MMNMEMVDLNVIHIGAGQYNPDDKFHSTFDIWRELRKGFKNYTVVGRSCRNELSILQEANLSLFLLPSRFRSESEFLFTQRGAIQIGVNMRANVALAQCPVKGGLACIALKNKIGTKILSEIHGFEYFTNPFMGTSHWVLQQLTGFTLDNSDRIRVLSTSMQKRLMEKYGSHHEKKIVCLPPRVDLKVFKNTKKNWLITKEPTIVMVGAINENKGQKRFIKTLLESKLNAKIWIIGSGPDQQKAYELSILMGGRDKVKFWGNLKHNELAQILPQADVLVMFSISEGTPRAILEAMATGLPIITTNAGFCADVVEHGIQGFVLGNDPCTEVIERLEQLFTNYGLRMEMGLSARERVESEYDADKLFERYRILIRETAEA